MIKVKWLKAHHKFSYNAGDVGYVTAEWAEKLLPEGYIIPLPDTEKETEKINSLPTDMPGREKLFAAGFDDLEKIREAGDGILDVIGISVTMLKKITKYLRDKV